MLSRLDAGEITDAEYFRWRTGQIMTGKHWEQMRDQLAADLVHSHQLADSVVNGYLPEVYALNHNYETYQIEHDLQMSTSYTLYNREAVERLLRDDPDLLPQPKVNIPKTEHWNKQHIQSSVFQGILQGESMDKIARRMQNVCGMDARAAIRNARTATTGAENAGRLDSMNRAIGLGVRLKKMWLAIRDQRTRDSHILLDGELREVDEKFSNGCMHPGDPHGRPEEIYNCRCAMRSKVAGADPYSPDLSRNERLGGMSYEEWKEQAKERSSEKSYMGSLHDELIDWDQTSGRIVTKEEREDLISYAKQKGINLYALNRFDGDPALLKAQIDEIAKQREEYPELFSQHQSLTITFEKPKKNNDQYFAETRNMMITYNTYALRDRKFTESQFGNYFSFREAEGIAKHEVGHIIEKIYGFKCLDLAYRAYENVYGEKPSFENIMYFLKNNISIAAGSPNINAITGEPIT